MARCFPRDPDFPEERRAERDVWEALCEQLPDDAVLFHSLQLCEGGNDYEADLVVAWPGVGVAVVEVKGGEVSYREGQWFQRGRTGEHPIGDPVVQAQDVKHVLHRYLATRSTDAAHARAAHLVAFPYTDVPATWELPGCPRDIVVDRRDMRRTAEIVRAAIETHGSGHRPVSADDAGRLVECLAGQLGGQLSLLSIAEEHEHRVDQMTRDQARVLDVLRYQTRAKVVGGAGTGKTWLALEQARRLAHGGQRVALVCYSRGLARFFERATEGWPVADRPAYVGLFHRLPLQWGADPPPADTSDLAAQSEYYEVSLPAQMTRLAAELPEAERYDAIVVDEAQDFGQAWWPPTLRALKDAEAGGLFVFLDEAQRIFNRAGDPPIALPPYVLPDNVRNTKQIAQTFGSLAAEQARYRGMDGPPVRFVACATSDAVDAADDQIDGLLDDGWEPGQVALLTTGRRHPEQRELVETHGDWTSYWDEFFAETSVFYGHVLGFKGLERPVVVLAVNGLRDEERAREYLYVGLSRARTQLVVCGDLDLIAKYGGEGLRRRLERAG